MNEVCPNVGNAQPKSVFKICLYGQISTIIQICPGTTTTTTTTMTLDQPTLLDDINPQPGQPGSTG